MSPVSPRDHPPQVPPVLDAPSVRWALQPFPTFQYRRDPASHDRKSRPIQACTECRRRKTKCDRVFPCSQCISRGEGETCEEFEKEKGPGFVGYTHLNDFDTLVQRVRQLETLLFDKPSQLTTITDHRDGLDGQPFQLDSSGHQETMSHLRYSNPRTQRSSSNIIPSYDTEPGAYTPSRICPEGSSSTVDPPNLRYQLDSICNDESNEPPSKAPSLTEHNAALALEDLAFSRTGNVERPDQIAVDLLAGPGLGRTPSNTDSIRSPFRSTAQRDSLLDSTQMAAPSAFVRIPDIDILPPRSKATQLISHFLDHTEWLFRCLHRPTFRHQCAEFIASQPKNPMSLGNASFVALYSACLCSTIHLMEDCKLSEIGYSPEDRTRMSQAWYELTMSALEKMDWTQNHRIETLQAIILVGPYMSSVNRSESLWAITGSAIKVAQNLGLSRLGPELPLSASPDQIRLRFGRRYQMAADREVGRRCWFTLLEADWTFSAEHHFTYVVGMELQKSIEPANVNDEDLQGYGPIISQPLSIHTETTFLINRLQFIYPLHRFVTKVNGDGRLRHHFLLDAHRDVITVTENLSPFYRASADPGKFALDAQMMSRISAERKVIVCGGHLKMLRMHRIYLSQAYRFPKYAFSKEVCSRSARYILDERNLNTAPEVPSRYWPMVYGIFTATVTMFINLCYAGSFEAAEAADMVRQGIRMLKLDTGSEALAVSADAIQRLLYAEQSERREPSGAPSTVLGKRKQGNLVTTTSELHRLIKRVAQKRNPSPSPHEGLVSSSMSTSYDRPHVNNAQPTLVTTQIPASATSNQPAYNDSMAPFGSFIPMSDPEGLDVSGGLCDYAIPGLMDEDANVLEFLRYAMMDG